MNGRLALAGSLLIAAPVFGQVKVELPPLTIEGSALASTATFDSARGVYAYEYTLSAAPSNLADVTGFSIDISGRVPRPQLDPDLRNGLEREEVSFGQMQPSTAIPVGIDVPQPWVAARVNGVSRVAFALMGPGHDLQPGRTMGGFVLESKLPPGWRDATITPSSKAWIPIVHSYPVGSDVEFSYGSPSQFAVHTKVLAPIDLDESVLFLGGGQSPREVDPFLRFASPTESRIILPPSTEAFDVVVVFGPNTDPASFSATLDGADITSQFRPMAGVVDTVRIPLAAGNTKLELSIEGTTGSGRSARDTDTLMFVVE